MLVFTLSDGQGEASCEGSRRMSWRQTPVSSLPVAASASATESARPPLAARPRRRPAPGGSPRARRRGASPVTSTAAPAARPTAPAEPLTGAVRLSGIVVPSFHGFETRALDARGARRRARAARDRRRCPASDRPRRPESRAAGGAARSCSSSPVHGSTTTPVSPPCFLSHDVAPVRGIGAVRAGLVARTAHRRARSCPRRRAARRAGSSSAAGPATRR